RTIASRLVPVAAPLDHLRPKRKRAALCWLGGMNRAPVGFQKRALLFARLAKPPQMPCAIDILRLERFRRHPHKLRRAPDISLAEIDRPFHVATLGASGLAF